jgi:uracil-DNA glycosylase family 4
MIPAWFFNKIQECQSCALYKTRHKVAPYKLAHNTKLDFPQRDGVQVLFIGESPGDTEDMVGIPFCGQAGKLLDRMIAEVGIATYAVVNTICCRPVAHDGSNRPPNKTEISKCRNWIQPMIRMFNPQHVVFIGKVPKRAYEAYCQASDIPAITMLHPAYVMRHGGVSSPHYIHDIRILEDVLEFIQGEQGGDEES